jgi:hypothetical protein
MPPGVGEGVNALIKFAMSRWGMATQEVVTGIGDAKSKTGGSKALSVAKTGAMAALWIAAPEAAMVYMTGELLYTGYKIGNDIYLRNSQHIRSMRTSFSHSFSHTDATFQHQQRGMAAIGRSRGLLGNEAGMMASLYGRRQ